MQWIAPSKKSLEASDLERRLWNTADQFRANSRLKAQEYYPVVACVSSDAFVPEATANAKGAKMPHAIWDMLENFSVLIPIGEMAEKVGALFSEIIEQQLALIFQIQNARRKRDLLLPRLHSGQLSVSTNCKGDKR